MFRKAASWTVLALLVLTWAMTLRPVALGGPATYVVVTGQSMEPTFHDGDLIVLRAADSYDVGEVVTFPVPEGTPGSGALIIHRITGGSEAAFTIQGDNNPHADEWTPGEADILGAEWFLIPQGGVLLRGMMNPAMLAAIAGGFITIYVLMKPAAGTRKSMNSSSDEPTDDSGPSPVEHDDTNATTREVQHA